VIRRERLAIGCVLAGVVGGCAASSSGPPAAVPARAESERASPLAVSVRPAQGRQLRTGGAFWYWLELKNVSNQTVAVRSYIDVVFSYAQGQLRGNPGIGHQEPCFGDTLLILPGQPLAQAGGVSQSGLKPGPATLDFAVTVHGETLDGACAKAAYEFQSKKATVDVLPANPGAKTGLAAVASAPSATGPASTFSVSMRPFADGPLWVGHPFGFWLGLQNVSSEAVAVHSHVGIGWFFSQRMRGGGTVGGGNTRQRWPLCEWETYRVLPGQTLTIEEHLDVDSFYARPGPAKLTVDVDFREANPDGTCAAREYKLGLPTRKVIIAGRRR